MSQTAYSALFSQTTSQAYALVIDDHPLVAHGARHMLLQLPHFKRVLTAESGNQALTLMASEGAPLLTVVDFWLDEDDATRFIKDMLSLAPATRILMTSGDRHPAIASKARAAGAHGFVAKARSTEDFLAAVQALLSGGQWFDTPEHLHPASVETHPFRMTARELGITTRQAQVLTLVLRGKPNRAIAQALSLSEHTVKEHVTAVLQRLGAANRVELFTKLRGVELSEDHALDR